MVANKTHASFSSSLNNGFQLGSNAGTLEYQQNHHYHYPPEPPETPPSPSLFIPFNRDPDFIDRKTILKQLDRRCAEPGSRTALVGLSGVGKSQLAIEYAYRVHRRSPETWVFWVHASNAYRFEQGYRDIADSVKLPGRRDPKANIFKLVHDWLRASKNGKWVLILDNVDDAGFLINHPDDTQGQAALDNGRTDRPLLAYIPPNGSLLITSQSKEAALELVKQRNLIAVDRMDQEHAQELLERKLEGQSNHQDTVKLAAMLEYMPLAIVQAAAYISDPDRNCSVQQYINEFHESDYLKIRLLEEDEGQFRRDWEAKNSVLKTWVISFNRIRQSRQSAADLLSLMSFFDRQGIPKALLQHQNIQDNLKPSKDNKSDTTESSSNLTDELNKDILKLQRYSLISVNIDQESFNMHSLVQLVTRRWLEVNGKLEKWKQQYIQNLYVAFPIASYENWAQCQLLFPHARSAADQRPHERNSLMEWAAVMYKSALFDQQKGNGADGEKLATRAIETYKEYLGPEHEETVTCMELLGKIYLLRGRLKEAEQLQVQVLELHEQVLGTEHPDTLDSMENLASIYRDQGRWKEAEQLQVQVLKLRKQILGSENPDTLNGMANLASIYLEQGQWKEAEQLQLQVLKLYKQVLGSEHPDTLASMNNLASTYRDQGRWKEAEQLQVQVLELYKQFLESEHPDILASMTNLASTYLDQGQWKEAEQLQVQVLELRKQVLGSEHPSTLASINNLASTYFVRGRWKEAEQLQVQVLELHKQVLGSEHPSTLTSMANLALTWKRQGKLIIALVLMKQCAELRRNQLGPDHPDTISSSDTLSDWVTAVDSPSWYSRQSILAFSFLAFPCLYFVSKILFKRRVSDG